MTDTLTIRQLAADPTLPLPYGDDTEGIPESYVRRLLDWAGMCGYDEHTSILLRSRSVSGNRDWIVRIPKHLRLPSIDRNGWVGSPSDRATLMSITGWNLRLTQPGRPHVDVTVLEGGLIHVEGTVHQQEGERAARDAQRSKSTYNMLGREAQRRWDLTESTRERTEAQEAVAKTDAAWRDAIKAAIDIVPVADIARYAGISRERVYQIRDDRR